MPKSPFLVTRLFRKSPTDQLLSCLPAKFSSQLELQLSNAQTSWWTKENKEINHKLLKLVFYHYCIEVKENFLINCKEYMYMYR